MSQRQLMFAAEFKVFTAPGHMSHQFITLICVSQALHALIHIFCCCFKQVKTCYGLCTPCIVCVLVFSLVSCVIVTAIFCVSHPEKNHENHSVSSEMKRNSQSYQWIITMMMKCSVTKDVWRLTDRTAHVKPPWVFLHKELKSRCVHLWQAHTSQNIFDSLLDLLQKSTIHRT